MDHKEKNKEVLGLTRMTKKRLLELCKKDKLYQTPELNDVLYLHYQGLDCIECLDDYTELKCLWLECNAISEIQGLNKQTKLKCLFLQSNLIKKIENLEYCKELDTLNLSQNHIRKIENCGFEVLPVLNTLNLASNYLKDCESLRELENCKNLSVLDLSNNRIDDILVVKIFSQMPELKVLILQGNPVVSKIPQYRKTLILECKELTYLDSRPVFDKDRACAEAWKRGGYAEERKENERWNRKERKKMRDSVNATIHLRNKNRKSEDQVALIPSSDSEDDRKPQKKNIKVHLDSEVEMDSVWDEVSLDENSNKYLISNNNNEDQNNECSLLTNESKKVEEICDELSCVMEITQAETEIEKDFREQEEHCSQANFEEFKQIEGEAKIPIITLKHSSDSNEFKELKINSSPVNLDETKDIKIPVTTSESDKDSQQDYAMTIEALKQITASLDSSESLLQQPIEECDSTERNNEENYELFKELEENMNVFSEGVKYDQKACQFEKKEEKPLRKIEKEWLRVNNQLKTDFEELSSSMSNFLNQLEKELEERQEVKKALFCNEKAAKESSFESSDNEDDNIKLKSKLGCLVDRWDRETKINKREENLVEKEEEVTLSGRIRNGHFRERLPSNRENVTNSFKADNHVKLEISTENDDRNSLEYVPIDVPSLTYKSNEALKSLERESEKLKKLLQKLENRNEELFEEQYSKEKNEKEYESCRDFKGNLSLKLTNNESDDVFKQIIKNDIQKTNSDYNCFQNNESKEDLTKTNLEEVFQVVKEIVEEILKSLDSLPLKQKSHERSRELSESNEDLRQPEDTSKTLPEVIDSFNQVFHEIEKSPLENFDKQKALVLKELSQKSNLKQFNNDTLQSLNVQLEQIRKNQNKKVRRMVDRVYAQKDRYNDTLELNFNKLMVRNHVTNELQELPKPLQYETSDSEDGYDTALSEEDVSRKEKLKLFKPKVRKSNEELVLKALNENKHIFCNDESGESSDEFFSLDGQDKANLYQIDKDLFRDLSFDFSNLTQQDENHIVQCARSYEDLKHCLTLNQEEKCLTEQENKLLENISKNKCACLEAETLESNKICLARDQEPTSQLDKFSEKIATNIFLREILERQGNEESLHEKKE